MGLVTAVAGGCLSVSLGPSGRRLVTTDATVGCDAKRADVWKLPGRVQVYRSRQNLSGILPVNLFWF